MRFPGSLPVTGALIIAWNGAPLAAAATKPTSRTRGPRAGTATAAGSACAVVVMLLVGCTSSASRSTQPRSTQSTSADASTTTHQSSRSAAPSTDTNFDILFDSGGWNGQLYLMHNSRTRLFSSVTPAVYPALSPDHRQVLFNSPAGMGVMTLTGKRQTIIPRTTGCLGGAWLGRNTIVASCGSPGWPGSGGSDAGGSAPSKLIAMTTTGQHRRTLGMTDPGDPPSASPTTHAVAYGLDGNVYITTPSGTRPHLLFIGTESVLVGRRPPSRLFGDHSEW